MNNWECLSGKYSKCSSRKHSEFSFLIFFKIYYSSISIKEKNKKRDRYRRLTSWQNNEGECKYFIIPTVKFSSNHVELLEKLTGEKEKKTKQKEVIIGNKPRA